MPDRPSTLQEPNHWPFATYALLVAQFVVWLVARRYLVAGGDWAVLANNPAAPSGLGFLVSPFVHLDPAHLGANLLVLWLIGTNLERAVGSVKFLALYLGSAWFASLMHWAAATSFHLYADPASHAALGSSGAVAGILGASLIRFARPRLRLPLVPTATFPVAPLIVLWLGYTVLRALYNTLTGITEGVGHWAHLAGFVLGLSGAQVLGFQRDARWEHLVRSALDATEREDYATASRSWAALLAIAPLDAEIRLALLSARLAMHDLPGARRVARDGIDAFIRSEDRAATLSAFHEYSARVPDLDLHPGARFRIGCWLAEAGDGEGAFRAMWESVREDGAPAGAGALYRAGQVAWDRLQSSQHAREAWERLLEQFPDSAWSDAARDGLRRLPAAG